MDSTNMFFDFGDLGAQGTERARRLSGATITVYPCQIGISPELISEMGDPDRLSIGYREDMEAFFLYPAENGAVLNRDHGSYMNATDLAQQIARILGYSRKTHYCRLQNGQVFGKCCIFRRSEAVLLGRGKRN